MVFADVDLKTIADRAYDDTLPMSMKEDMKTTDSEAYDDRKHVDGAGADEDFIVIKADTKGDRCCFLFSIFVKSMPYVRVMFCLRDRFGIVVVFGCNSLGQGINIGRETI